MRIHTDLSAVPISVAPDTATAGTSLGVTDANAAYLPDTYPYWATLVPTGAVPTRSNSEIVKVTAGSSSGGTTTLTIVRAQGVPVTTAQSITTSFDIYDANSAEALPQVSSDVTETPSGSINGSNTAFTLTSTPTSGTLSLYLNGVRQTLTSDYTITGTAITMVTAPVTGDSLVATYSIVSGTFSTGSASWQTNETPSGTVNSSNTEFTLAFTPVSGTLALYRDGQLLTGGGADYTLSTATITFTTAPTTGSVLLAFYQSAVSTAGNADLLDGYHANATPTAGQIPVLDASATLPNSILSSEDWDSWIPSWTNVTIGNATVEGRYKKIGKIVVFRLGVKLGNSSSVSGNIIFSLPVTSKSYPNTATVQIIGQGGLYPAGTGVTYAVVGWNSTTTAFIGVNNSAGTYVTNAATSSTVPFTWATNHEIYITGFYEAV